MDEDISANYMCYPIAKELWDNVSQMHSDLGNYSKIYELQQKIGKPQQGEDNVTKYFNVLKGLWQDLDLFNDYEWKSPDDCNYNKKMVENARIFKFLEGLNDEIDEVRGRILGRQSLPPIGDSEVRREDCCRDVMVKKKGAAGTVENSALVAANPIVLAVANSSAQRSYSNQKSQVWCDYCNKPCHTQETCWKLHGKPANWNGKYPFSSLRGSVGKHEMDYYSGGHICQCLSQLATLQCDSTVIITGDRKMTGKQFVEGVLDLAYGLLQLGVGSGYIVAISAFNRDLYLEWLLAVAFVGAIVAPLNYRWSFEEARSAMEVVSPIMLVTDDSCSYWHSELQNNHIPSLRWYVFMCSHPDRNNTEIALTTEMLKSCSLRPPFFNYSWAPQDAVLICFTSGTTGRPKGVTISHSALIVQSLAKIDVVGYNEDDVYLHAAPLCHIGGISSALAMLMKGGSHVIIPKFEARLALDAIEQHHVTSLITVPAIMADLVSLIRTKETWKGKQSVKKILNGGGSLTAQLINEATKFFPKAKLLSAYGMTEACSSLTFMTLYDPKHESSNRSHQIVDGIKSNSVQQLDVFCVGKPAPHVKLRIRVEESSNVGRILTSGPHVMLGYWGEALAKTSSPCDEGWLDTGDVGRIDGHGNLWLIGRASGRIKSGGENVYPEEVEAVLSQHPGVSCIVVVGVPDVRLTEMVVACICLKENWQWIDDHSTVVSKQPHLSSDALRQFCKERNLTGFKIPKLFVVWREPFPVTLTGKLRRDQVKKDAISRLPFFASNL
ncbi:2-succinylbenzoate--CoA ligase, chloroplastic/peroxisomal [Malania oleifera]|uniref:2-succinylbenzoate--CoA ligase, chloroplastic/peroxisomal n=1 Tax=Malania oleifera TaxID=397392 RepID=UPI0025AE5148|nr:2-succinylbenzoate--CoA ligase, chloroplastic/peroxisomal [Malania oleifera]